MKTILALLLLVSPLLAAPYTKHNEEVRVFVLYDYVPTDWSNGDGYTPFRLSGDHLEIFKVIRKYWEKKTGAHLACTAGKDHRPVSRHFVVLIAGDTARFSTKENGSGPLASGVFLYSQPEDLGVVKKIKGKWVLTKDETSYGY